MVGRHGLSRREVRFVAAMLSILATRTTGNLDHPQQPKIETLRALLAM